MAYLRQIGARWKCEVRVTLRTGEVARENSYHDSKVAAREHGLARERELLSVRNGGFPPTTVSELLARWREEVAPTRGGARWDINRLLLLERLTVQLGYAQLQLQDFGPREMAQVRKSRLETISPPSVQREETLLKSVWARARHPEWHLTDVDPFKDLGGIKGSKGRARRRKATWSELRRILRQLGYHPCRDASSKQAEVGLAMMLALRTTLRSQEVLQLGDDCVDLARLVVTVPQHKTRYITQEAKRVPLMPKALVLLARKCLGRERYFTVTAASRDSLFRRAKILAGVPDLTFHDLKRTVVMLLKQSLTEDELMAVTGNADVAVLRRHYMTDTAAEAAKAVWRALGADRVKVFGGAGVPLS